MEYVTIHTIKTGWLLGKIYKGQAIALTEEEIGLLVKFLNENNISLWEESHQSASGNVDVEKQP